MKEYLEIEVEERTQLGRSGARQARRQGLVPGVVYGGKRQTVPVLIDSKRIQGLLSSESGMNTIFMLNLKGKGAKRHVMIRDFQRDPVTNDLVHADFIRILMDEKVEVAVPVHIAGIAEGVKNQGGLLDFVMRDIRISCLPSQIPEHFVADVTALEIGDSVKVEDLARDAGLQILTPGDQTVVVISPPVKEQDEVEEAAEDAEAAEPEVIQKGKVAEEDKAEEGSKEEKGQK
jgi:large subunit ribosomal protein L25